MDGLLDRRGIRRVWFVVRSLGSVLSTAIRESVFPTTNPTVGPCSNHPTLSTRGEKVLSSTLHDIRYALRSLLHQPGFSTIAVLTIALGIGANTAIFSVVNGVLLRPLPFEKPGELVIVGTHDMEDPDGRDNMSLPDIEDVAALPAFEKLVGYRTRTMTLTGYENPQLAKAAMVTDGILGMLGSHPSTGRDLTAEEADPNGPRVLVVSHRLWQEQLGGEKNVIGTSIEMSEVPWEVVGVAPPGFSFPDGTDIWYPDRLSTEYCDRGCRLRLTLGRLAPGAQLSTAQTQLTVLAERLALEYPDMNHEVGFGTNLLRDQIVGDVRAGLWVLTGAVGLVLLIACGNVAILLLVRANARQGEIATRAALGASRGRLIRQILLESQILAMAGAAIGTAGAYVAVGTLKGLSAGTIPRIEQVTLDWPVLAFSLCLTVVVALLFGLVPVATLTRDGMIAGLRSSSRGRVAPKGSSRFRSALLAFEVAMSILLLTGSGLLLKTFTRMFAVDLGYETEQIVRFSLAIPDARYETLNQVALFYRTLDERIQRLPGVAASGAVFGAPLGPDHYSGWISVDGRGEPEVGQETYASVKTMTPGYFDTMRIPLLRGRSIEAADIEGTVPVAVVNETFVAENFPDEDPIGKQVNVAVGYGYADPGWTIVGVVRDIRSRSLTREPESEIYVAHAQYGPNNMTVSVRGETGATHLLPAIRNEVMALDPNVPLRQIETVQEAMKQQVAPTRFYLLLVVAFAGLAVLLSAVGLYGVVAYLVSRQTREIGIRIALGARIGLIVRLVTTQGLYPALGGLVVGLVASLAFTRVLGSLLFEVQPNDPGVLVGVSVLVLLVSGVATLIPARRALRIDPVIVMRTE